MMAYESLPKSWMRSQCTCADGISRVFNLNIFKWLFPTKTKNVSFYSLSHVLSDSVTNFIQVQYQNLTFLSLKRNTETENCQAAINGPNASGPTK